MVVVSDWNEMLLYSKDSDVTISLRSEKHDVHVVKITSKRMRV